MHGLLFFLPCAVVDGLSPVFPGAVTLLLVAACKAADHEGVMCALPKVAQKCPIWTEMGYKHQVSCRT